jgi:hypothetical protein
MAFGWLSMSYYNTIARARLDLRIPSSTRLNADFAAQIGRCSRPNSTASASARTLTWTRPHSARIIRQSALDCGGPLPSASYQHDKMALLPRRRNAECRRPNHEVAGVIGTVSAFFSHTHIVYFGMSGNKMRRSPLSGPIFQGVGFSYWLSNGHSGQLRRKREKVTGGVVLLATHNARSELGANLLSLLAVSGCSAEPNGCLMARVSVGAIIAAFRKGFSRGQIVPLLYAAATD